MDHNRTGSSSSMNDNSNDGKHAQAEKGDAGVEDRTTPKVQSELEDKKLGTSLHRSLHDASCHRAATATAATTADAVAAAKDHLRNTGDDFTLGAWAVIENGNDISVTPRGAVERSDYNRAFQEIEDGLSVDSGIDFFEDLDLQYEDGDTASKDGLARAFKVEDDDEIDPMHLPAGLEFDPDAKPPELIHRENLYRTIRFYSIFVATVLVIVALGGVAGLGMQRSVPDALPDRATLGIREYVVEQLLSAYDGEQVLKDPTNPYRRALDWIQNSDAMALTPQNGTKFTQRFLAAYFYFSTSVDGPWTSGCEPVGGDSSNGDGIRRHRRLQDNSCVHTVKLSTERLNDIVTAATRWLGPDDECLWGGVQCDEVGHIFSIDLNGSNMTGAIPEGIAGLPFLKRLSVALGGLAGPLPSVLGDMKHLSFVDLASNEFTGGIPDSWYQSRSFQHVNIGDNNINGTISERIGRWKDMREMQMHANRLSGSIPFASGDLRALSTFRLNGNALSGTIPTSIGNLRHPNFIVLDQNKLTGTIPKELGGSTLRFLRLDRNQLNGTVPTQLSDLSNLEELNLGDNQLTGSILLLANLTKLWFLRIANNQFSGTLPPEIGRLKDLEEFIASGNNFVGTVPRRICNLVGKTGSTKVLEVLELDCAAAVDGVVEISCPEDCCTQCCDLEGENCSPFS